MALEPAGVSLEAEGFQKYLKQLEAIDKKQQEVFDTKFKDTQLSFNQVTKAAKAYEKELKDLVKAERKAADEAKKLAAAQKIAAATQRQAAISTVNAAAQIGRLVAQGARAAFELGKLGATYEAQQIGLNNLAASFGQSGAAIQASIVKASRGSISDLVALRTANEALLLGVAKTPQEFDRFTRAALVLGRTVGLSASESINKFTTALGRESLLRLDDFGAKAAEVNAEITRLAQSELGKLPEQLTQAEKSSIFIEAALNVTGANVEKIGDEAGDALESFSQIEAASENIKTQMGLLVKDLDEASGASKSFASFLQDLGGSLRGLRVDLGFGDTRDEIASLEVEIKRFQKVREQIAGGAAPLTTKFLRLIGVADQEREVAKLDETIAELQAELERLELKALAEDEAKVAQSTQAANDAIETQERDLRALNQAVQQAEQLQLSFARAAEDAARKLARQQEDVARKTARQVAKLAERQAKDRDKLLKEQQKELDRFEDDRLKEIAKAEADVTKERQKAADDRLKQQRELQRQLAQAQARFNLSQLQSERRFALSETRLRAEGDILALQQLREDQELARQEEAENFALSQKETKDNAKEQQKEIQKDFESRINELKSSLEDQRAELLASFDEELIAQQQAQEEARAEQQRGFAEQSEDRAIALQREEEDRRISQERQLEDLGRSLANQKDVTEQGVTAIAGELEKVFGQEGVADIIISGFASRTESEFTELFGNIEQIVSGAGLGPVPGAGLNAPIQTAGGRVLPGFDEGGVVPGPVGSPQVIRAHAGETILPTHKQSFIMPAPVVPSQTLSVEMSGGFNISGGEGASAGVVDAAVEEVTETVRIAIGRIARRTNG